jgi:hemolysin activation/secretion protein
MHPVVTVDIPPQNITSGVVQLVVTEACLGKICCVGNKWFDNSHFLGAVSFDPGEAITTDVLLTDIAWMNRNPFRHTEVVFTPGVEEGTTDIELITCDRFPLRVYGGVDNTGTHATGNSRYFAGISYGNFFNLGHLFSYQFTADSEFKRFLSHTVNYVAPLPWRHILIMYGGYATVRPDIDHCKSKGHSSQVSVRYEIPFCSCAYRLQEFRFGFDWKNTNNNVVFLDFADEPIIANVVNISQLYASYNCGIDTAFNTYSLSLELFGSPGEILPHQSNHDFDELRPGAKNTYIYGLGTFGWEHEFRYGITFAALARAQLSSANLLPSEQFGLGGYDTVRGYNEREVNVDDALCINLELRSCPFGVLNYKYSCIEDELIFLVFLDYGCGREHKSADHKKDFYNLISIGPGIRYNICPWISARLDWGFKLHRTPFDDHSGNHIHFGVLASY